MPKNYDFSVRNVNWNNYKNDYILRTDAVWERSKLLDLFYTHYKSKFVYDAVNNRYMIANIDKTHCQPMSQSILKIGDRSTDSAISTDAFGNSKLVQCFKSHNRFSSLYQTEKVMVGTPASLLSKSSCFAMREVQLRLRRHICRMAASTTIHTMVSSKAFLITVVKIFLSQCSKCTRLDL